MAKERMLVSIGFVLEGASVDSIPDEWHVTCQACEDIAGNPAYGIKHITVSTAGTDTRDQIETAILAAVNAELGT